MTRSRLTSAVLGVAALTSMVLVGPAASAGTGDPNDAPPTVTTEDCGDAFSAVTVTPAPGFDANTATAEQLAANNFPPRPDPGDTEAMTAWTSYVTGPIDRASRCDDLGKAEEGNGPIDSAVPPAQRHNSANWSGNVANDRRFNDADASWVLPADRDTDHVARASVQWVGLGGTAGGRLIQAGTFARVMNGVTSYCVFIEDYPFNAVQCLRNAVHPGDHIYVHVHQVAGTGSYHVVDTNQRIDRTFSVTDSGVGTSAESAEWILERPVVGGRLSELAHTDPVTFTGARAAGPGFGFIGLPNLGHFFDVMQTCDHLIQLAHPGPINAGNNSFQGIWDAHGHSDPARC
jgi:Peptidase A4 family